MANEKKIPVGGWLDPTTPEHILGSSSDIIDEDLGQRQSEINSQFTDLSLNGFFEGKGDTNEYAQSYKIKGLSRGNIYMVSLPRTDWDITGVTSKANYFGIEGVFVDGETFTKNAVVMENRSQLQKKFLIEFEKDVDYLQIGGRAAKGTKVYFSIIDVTNDYDILNSLRCFTKTIFQETSYHSSNNDRLKIIAKKGDVLAISIEVDNISDDINGVLYFSKNGVSIQQDSFAINKIEEIKCSEDVDEVGYYLPNNPTLANKFVYFTVKNSIWYKENKNKLEENFNRTNTYFTADADYAIPNINSADGTFSIRGSINYDKKYYSVNETINLKGSGGGAPYYTSQMNIIAKLEEGSSEEDRKAYIRAEPWYYSVGSKELVIGSVRVNVGTEYSKFYHASFDFPFSIDNENPYNYLIGSKSGSENLLFYTIAGVGLPNIDSSTGDLKIQGTFKKGDYTLIDVNDIVNLKGGLYTTMIKVYLDISGDKVFDKSSGITTIKGKLGIKAYNVALASNELFIGCVTVNYSIPPKFEYLVGAKFIFDYTIDFGSPITDDHNMLRGTFGGIYNTENIAIKCREFASMLNNTKDVDSFIFFSDSHPGNNLFTDNIKKCISQMQKYYNNLGLDFVLFGGDWLNDKDTSEEACYKLRYLAGVFQYAFRDRFYQMVGNHDTNYQGDKKLTQDTLRNVMFPQRTTTYYTFLNKKTRYYILDTGLDGEGMTPYKWTQISWLANQLLVNKDKHIIIAFHIYSEAGPKNQEDWVNLITDFAKNTMDLAIAYNNKTSITLNIETYNFASTEGRVGCFFCGHTHFDYIDTSREIPVFCITAAWSYPSGFNQDLCLIDWDKNVLRTIGLGVSRVNREVNLA